VLVIFEAIALPELSNKDIYSTSVQNQLLHLIAGIGHQRHKFYELWL